jgi:hypothetical protein
MGWKESCGEQRTQEPFAAFFTGGKIQDANPTLASMLEIDPKATRALGSKAFSGASSA